MSGSEIAFQDRSNQEPRGFQQGKRGIAVPLGI